MYNIKFCVRYGKAQDIKDSYKAAKFLREHTKNKKARLQWGDDYYDEDVVRYAYVNSNHADWYSDRVYTTDSLDWSSDPVVELKNNYLYVGLI